MRIAVIVLCLVATRASAAPPSGYACGDGKVIKDKGCDCPAGKMPARDAENTAICVAKPVTEPKVEPTACLAQRAGKRTLKITTVPPIAELYIGAKSCGRTQHFNAWTGAVNSSPLYAIISAPGFDDVKQLVDPARQSVVTIEFASWGLIQIDRVLGPDGKPVTADIVIDGIPRGRGGEVTAVVKPGRRTITASKDGFALYSTVVDVKQGTYAVHTVKLAGVAAPATGTLRVSSTVPRAKVFVDGADSGTVPFVKEMVPGEHFVVVRLDGYKDFESRFRIELGKTVTIEAKLEPEPAGSIAGRVVDAAKSKPLAGVTVVVTSPALQGPQTAITDEDGNFKITSLPPGTYEVTLYYGEGKKQRPGVAVTAGREVSLNMSMDAR